MVDKLKISKFIDFYVVEDVYYVFSTLTNYFLECYDYKLFKYIINEDIEKINQFDKDLSIKLSRLGFYISKNLNETEEIIKQIKKFNNIPYICNLTLVVDHRCNLKCPYCFQDRIDESHLSINKESILFNFLNKSILNEKIKFLFVRYYGGEPLLNIKSVLRTQKWLWEKCFQKNILLKASIFTNGTLLDVKILNLLNREKILTINVSLDVFRIQDKDNFYNIIAFLKEARNFSDIQVNLRLNADRNYKKLIDNIGPVIKEYNLKKYISIYVESIFEYHPHKIGLRNIKYKFEALNYLIDKYNIVVVDFPRTKKTGCYTSMKNSFIIDSNLNTYQCHHDIGNQNMANGNIESRKKNICIYKKLGFNYKCYICKYFPICLGECSTIRSPSFITQGCRYNKQYFLRYFQILHKLRKKNVEKIHKYYIDRFA